MPYFKIERDKLFALVASVQAVCGKRTTIDITESLLFLVSPREIILKATDMEVSIQSSLDIESDLTETAAFLISGKRIFEILREVHGDLMFIIQQNAILLQVGNEISFSLSIQDSAQFPQFPEKIENIIEFSADDVLELIDKIVPIVPQNNPNRALNGVLLELGSEGLSCVGADGYTLARYLKSMYASSSPLQSWLVPRRAFHELKKLIEIDRGSVLLGVCSGQLVFSGNRFNFFTRLLADKFPSYTAILKRDDFIKIDADRIHLVQALRRATAMLAGQFISGTFSFYQNQLTIRLHNKDLGTFQEIVPLKSSCSKELVMNFYPPYLLQALQLFKEELIPLYIKGPLSPIIIESTDDKGQLVFVVMPVSKNNDA